MNPDQTNEKKTILQQLVRHVLQGGPGKSIHEVISNLKAALGAYKNYSKEWDNLHGITSDTGAKSAGGAQPPASMLAPKSMQPPQMVPQYRQRALDAAMQGSSAPQMPPAPVRPPQSVPGQPTNGPMPGQNLG